MLSRFKDYKAFEGGKRGQDLGATIKSKGNAPLPPSLSSMGGSVWDKV